MCERNKMSDSIYPKILFEKDGFCMMKENSTCFKISFVIENTRIYLENIINFDLIKLVYDLNPDIFETIDFKKNENDANIYFVMKHFFEDLGMPQFYNHIHVTKSTMDKYIIFKMQPIKNEQFDNNNNELVQMPLEEMEVVCYKMTPHKITFQYNILFNRTREIPPYVEKLVGNIIYKIFNRVKGFIDNVNV